MADSAKGQALAPPPKLERDLRSRLLGEYGILIIVVVMAAALSFLQPQYFLSAQNVTNIVRQIGMNALLALGMYRRRYWAVLGFEGLLAFQILVTSLALVVASTLPAAGGCLVSTVLAGWLFWKLIRVMGRIQAGERR